jgi:hypothetical protein
MMTIAKQVRTELRAVLGPKWVASAAMWIIIATGLALVGMVAMGTIELASGLNETLEAIK